MNTLGSSCSCNSLVPSLHSPAFYGAKKKLGVETGSEATHIIHPTSGVVCKQFLWLYARLPLSNSMGSYMYSSLGGDKAFFVSVGLDLLVHVT